MPSLEGHWTIDWDGNRGVHAVGMTATLNQYKQKQGMLPAGLNLQIALLKPITTKGARVGDLIDARLESAVHSAELELPVGALLKGRISEFAKESDPPNTYAVLLEFSELDWGDNSDRFFAKMVGSQPLAGIRSEISESRQIGKDSLAGRTTVTISEALFNYSIPGVTVFFLTDMPSLPKGFWTRWRTIQPKARPRP